MKQEFEMQQEEMDSIIEINKNSGGPVMKIGNYISGMDLQKNINSYWAELGKKYGFKPMTVEPSSRGKLFFLAEPTPIEVPKTKEELETEEAMKKYPTLKSIVDQLEMSPYECEGGFLKNNLAFIALKGMAKK